MAYRTPEELLSDSRQPTGGPGTVNETKRGKRVYFSIYVDQEMFTRIDALAHEARVSKNRYIYGLLKSALANMGE